MNPSPVATECLCLDASTIDHWHHTADVVVLGLGIAGACAALEARRAGADVLGIERASAGGGASALSSGLFYLGGGTAVQQAVGLSDSADNMYRFMTASMGTEQADKIRLYCDASVDHFNWLEAQGIPFERSYHAGKAVYLLGTEGLLATGNEKVWPFRELATPVARGHQVAHPGENTGALAMSRLLARCTEAGVRTLCDTQASALIRRADGSIAGVAIRRDGQLQYVQAQRGVIITTGGFVMNPVMVADHLRISPTFEPLGGTWSDGSGIRLGQAAGAATEAMDGLIATASIYPPGQLIKGIIVNQNGRRFVAEDSYHGRTAAFIAEQPNQRAYLIVDEAIFAYPEIDSARHRLIDGYASVADMEAGLELPAGSLSATLERYNHFAARGEDPDFHKYQEWLKPLNEGAYAAFDISTDHSSYLYMSLGGLRTNTDAQVLDAAGNPIPNLYAAGACSAHIPQTGKSYASGMSLGPGSYFGRRAGLHAARRP